MKEKKPENDYQSSDLFYGYGYEEIIIYFPTGQFSYQCLNYISSFKNNLI